MSIQCVKILPLLAFSRDFLGDFGGWLIEVNGKNDVLCVLYVMIECSYSPVSACCRRTEYDALRMCVGEEMCRKLAELHVFMVNIFQC